MLVQYSVKNYKTFEKEAKISFVASKYYSEKEDDNVVDFPQFSMKLLKSAVIYGANASGKSKLFDSMEFARRFILSSSKDKQINEPIEVDPFRLNSESEKEPSSFELIFILNNEMYRYGFEATAEKIVSEWLYHRPKTKEVELFFRDGQHFEIHETKFKVKDLISKDRIRPNALLLSVAASWNDKVANKIISWVEKEFKVIYGLSEHGYLSYSLKRIKENISKESILNFMKNADLGIDDLSSKAIELDSLPNEFTGFREALEKRIKDEGEEVFSDIFTSHKKYNNEKEEVVSVKFRMDEDESSGTLKFFALSGPILSALDCGDVLIVDELDAKLHPNLTRKIIELFNSKNTNPKNAQLIFNTHDTNLLDIDLFRRDQIWFTEKDRYGAASLYSLSDIKGVRKDDLLEKNYISGKYGAIPFLGNFDPLFKD